LIKPGKKSPEKESKQINGTEEDKRFVGKGGQQEIVW